MQEYIYGGPWFGGIPTNKFNEFVAPLGQVDIYLKFLGEMPQDMISLTVQAGKEYTAIAAAMQELGIKFYLSRLSSVPILNGLSEIFEKGFKSKPVPLPEKIDHELAFYPRDIFLYLKEQNAVLFNSQVRRIVDIPQKSKCDFYFSPYGEGGGSLYARNIMIVGNRYVDENIVFKNDRALDILKRKGIDLIVLPSPIVRTFSRTGLGNKAGIDEHIDRSMNLIEAPDGGLYLIVDPEIHLARGKEEKKQFSLILPEEAKEIIKAACEPVGIDVIYPKRINVPCSLGFMQFANKKILMTGGDDSVRETLERIVGRDNIAKTYVPTVLTAILGRAGIRCTINEYPGPLQEIFPPLP